MLLFTTLLLALIVSIIFAVIAIGVGGAAFILVFGDALVCVLLLVAIIKLLSKKKSS